MPPRKAKKVKYAQEGSDDEDYQQQDEQSDDDYVPAAKSPSKSRSKAGTRRQVAPARSTGSRAPGRRKRGRLEDLPNMPLDIIFEVRLLVSASRSISSVAAWPRYSPTSSP